ncbi:unnamed protein product [Rotaria magnacalcarata]|uniref:Protein kinase domain-containing protein n=6 Tax=Rotaria magnacalcarata TaxID=392030 RepID=A0A814JV39_9BILA|nr:unnamed protein product [Rotaria magnacalcarata]
MDLHYKKDGSLDMRYSSSRGAMSSGFGGASHGSGGGSHGFGGGSHGFGGGASNSHASSSSTAFSGLHHKKDGTLDMRYNSSRAGAAASIQSSYPSRPSSSSALHYKKDGTLDMRFGSSKMAASAVQPSYTNRPPSSSELHYKKDGTLDMRYGSSKMATSTVQSSYTNRPPSASALHYKKDGTLDMRYSSSKDTMAKHITRSTFSQCGIPSNIPVTNAGIPDMRTTAAKEWVKQQAQKGMEDIPPWIPRTKDGSLDVSKPITQEYMKWKDTASTNCDPNQRLAYYLQKLQDELFQKLVESARETDVETPQYEMLPEIPEIQREFSCPTNRGCSRQDFSSSMSRSSRGQDNEYDMRSRISESVTAINYNDLKINPNNELGRGAFGIVYKAIWNNQVVAVKQLHLNNLTRQEKNSFVKEIRIMSSLGEHPNLVYLHGYTLVPPCLVMEYVELGSLSYLLHYCEDAEIEARITDGRMKKRLMLGTALGMNQLHAANIVHGDLKPQNVLISRDYTAKVTDFGLATLRGKTSSTVASSIISDDGSTVCGTAGYMAPELLESSNPPEYSSDVYSFGVMLNEIIQEEEPYTDQFRNFLGRGPFAAVNYAKLGNRPRIKSGTPTFLRNFIERCWHRDPRSRPTFEQIFNELKPSHVNFPNSFEL